MSRCLCEDMPYFFGPGTFQNLPYVKEIDGSEDFVVLGLPFDTAATGRGESRFAPSRIRHHASYNSGIEYNNILKVMGTEAQGVDIGEADIKPGYTEPSLPIMEQFVTEAIKKGAVSIGMGGGQIVTLAELRTFKKKYGSAALIHLTAAGSLREGGEAYDDGNAVRKAAEEDLVMPDCSVQIGLRKQYCRSEEILFAEKHGIKTIYTDGFLPSGYKNADDGNLDSVINSVIERVSDNPCFISLNMNFLDPAYAPGVSVPVPGGADTYTLRTLIRRLASETNMKGFDIVDIIPAFDVGDIALQAADSIISDVVSAICLRKKEGRL